MFKSDASGFIAILVMFTIPAFFLTIIKLLFFRQKRDQVLYKKSRPADDKKGFYEDDNKYHGRNKSDIPEKVIIFFKTKLSGSKVFIHNTSDQSVANIILNEGFKFSDSLHKTSQELIEKTIDIPYKFNLYKEYGHYLIVICIPKDLFEYVQDLLLSKGNNQPVELALCEYNPLKELCYLLPPVFIAGYINMEDYTIIENKSFLKDYNYKDYIAGLTRRI